MSHAGRFLEKTAPCLDSCHWDTKQSNYTDDLTWINLNKYICGSLQQGSSWWDSGAVHSWDRV